MRFKWHYYYKESAHFVRIFSTVGRVTPLTGQQNDLSTQWRLRSAWASTQLDQSSLSTWRNSQSSTIHKKHSKGYDQTGQMPRLIWVFAGCTGFFLFCCAAAQIGCFLHIKIYISLALWDEWVLYIFEISHNIHVQMHIMHMQTVNVQVRLQIHVVLSESSFALQHDKTNKMTFAPSEDSDQPGHPSSLIRVFAMHSMES